LDLPQPLSLLDFREDVFRNIVSLRVSENLFDDLSDDPIDWRTAQAVEAAAMPPAYRSATPAIDRPFEEAEFINAIGYPFAQPNWSRTRFSDGSFGVWYGSRAAETTVYETAYHWVNGLLADAGLVRDGMSIERKVYLVRCDAALVDLRAAFSRHPSLRSGHDYVACQAIGRRLNVEGHPGLITGSVRHADGENLAILRPVVLSSPRMQFYLTYRLTAGTVYVERLIGSSWLTIPLAVLSWAH